VEAFEIRVHHNLLDFGFWDLLLLLFLVLLECLISLLSASAASLDNATSTNEKLCIFNGFLLNSAVVYQHYSKYH